MLLRSNFSSFPHYFIYYISNFRSQITYSFIKCGCSIYCFPHSLNSDMSRYGYLEVFSPLEFEITRVDCTRISNFISFSINAVSYVCFPVNPYRPSGLFYHNSLDKSISYISGVWLVFINIMFCRNF